MRRGGTGGSQIAPVIRNRRSQSAPDPSNENGPRRDMPDIDINVSPTESVSQPAAETTQEGRCRKRLRWTNEMNEYLYRSYLTITKMETTETPYSAELYNKMTNKFAELRNKTLQNILDQRRQLFIKNRLSPEQINKIRHEVSVELNLANEITAQTQDDINQDDETLTTKRNDINEELYNLFEINSLKYNGMEITKKPMLPKLIYKKNIHTVIANVNDILREKLTAHISLTEIISLIYNAAATILEKNGQKIVHVSNPQAKSKHLPAWERRLQNKILDLRGKIAILTQVLKNNPSKKVQAKAKSIINTYQDKDNHSILEINDLLKQHLAARVHRLKRYKESNLRKSQNHIFNSSQRAFYKSLNTPTNRANSETTPDAQSMKTFWKNIWSNTTQHNANATWIKDEKKHTSKVPVMLIDRIDLKDVQDAIKRTSNWKSPGCDKIQNFWIKKLTSTHEHFADAFTNILKHPAETPDFLTQGITYLLPKTETESPNPANYRPITCLSTTYKLLTSILSTKIYKHLEANSLIAEEQKGCRKGSQGCKEQLIADSVITEDARKSKKDLYIAYIDYKKAFDSIPHSWLQEVLSIYKINTQIITLLQKLMEKWETCLVLRNIRTTPISIKRGIFQGDSLSALWFCLALNPISNILNKSNNGYKLTGSNNRLTHLIYMDDIKLVADSKTNISRLLKQTERFSNDINMEFGIEKCRINGLKRGKWEQQEDHKLREDTGSKSIQPAIRSMDKHELYKYLGFEQGFKIAHSQIKQQLTEKLCERTKRILKSKLSAINKAKAVNTYAAPVVTFSFGIVRWTTTDLEDLNRKIRVLYTKHRDHHPRSSIERFHLPRTHGGRGVIDFVNAHYNQINNLRKFFETKSSNSSFHSSISKADINYTPLNLNNNNYDALQLIKTTHTKIEEWGRKELHGRHIALLKQPHIDFLSSNSWLQYGNIFSETEGFMVAIQDQVIPTRNYKKFILKDLSIQTDKCRLCMSSTENTEHLISGCKVLAPKEYTIRHDNVARILHQQLAKRLEGTGIDQPYYKYTPFNVINTHKGKLYWNRPIITDRTVTHNRPDIVYQEFDTKTTYLIDVAIPAPHNIVRKHAEKVEKYIALAQEIKDMWHAEKCVVVPIIIGATGEIPSTLHTSISTLKLPKTLFIELQKVVILETCSIVRKVLNHQEAVSI